VAESNIPVIEFTLKYPLRESIVWREVTSVLKLVLDVSERGEVRMIIFDAEVTGGREGMYIVGVGVMVTVELGVSETGGVYGVGGVFGAGGIATDAVLKAKSVVAARLPAASLDLALKWYTVAGAREIRVTE